ncbi:MAG: sulfite exporter TauE/SafE family protein [Flavobacteriales bacterium]
METIGYILAILVGLSSGLIGAGGSILAMPILVYLFGVEAADTAPAYSLFVIGVSSIVGAFLKYKQGQVSFKTVLYFGTPTVLAIFVTRYFVVPVIPDEILTVYQFIFTKRILVMGLFSCLMILAAYYMVRDTVTDKPVKINQLYNFGGGLFTGFLSGLVGAGGGFIMIPALIKIGNITMKTAIGTSLTIIAINSMVGFAASYKHLDIDWMLLLTFSGLAILGIVTGNYFSKQLKAENLKKGFGYFILVVGLFILIKEFIFKN